MRLGAFIVYAWIVHAITAAAVVVSVLYALRISWPLMDRDRRAKAWPHSRAALFGGLLLTSSPFWSLAMPLLMPWHELLPSRTFENLLPYLGAVRFRLSWLPEFFLGYALGGFLWKRWSKRSMTDSPVSCDAA